MADKNPKKVAVLGGGLASMTAVYELTNKPGWQDDYDVTVYHMGWKLGGKGASGRGENGRIEEHGLHIWMGFYHNAFKMMQAAYGTLKGRGGTFPTWTDAFEKHSLIGVQEFRNDEWIPWLINYPENDKVPGDDYRDPSSMYYIWQIMIHILNQVHPWEEWSGSWRKPHKESKPTIMRFLRSLVVIADVLILVACAGLLKAQETFMSRKGDPPPRFDQPIHDHTAPPPPPPPQPSGPGFAILKWMRKRFTRRLESLADGNIKVARLEIILEVAVAIIRGIVCDGLMKEPQAMDAIDKYDFREWLADHGASEPTYNSALVQGLYDMLFAYHNGDTKQPCLAAGSALRALLRINFTYKGAIFWKMEASMGDTIFTPLYYVLRDRGVKFEFFHKVEALNHGKVGESQVVESIDVLQQVTLKRQVGNTDRIESIPDDPEEQQRTDYYPFVRVKGLNCWPSQPLFDQLEFGDELKAMYKICETDHNVNPNLESCWNTWSHGVKKTLRRGSDFDYVLLGIPVESQKTLCADLLPLNPRWQQLVERVETNRTLAIQLWLKPTLDELGWPIGSAMFDSYVQPLNTWADMTHLVKHENWPENRTPGSLAYFCGTMVGGMPEPGQPDADYCETDAVKRLTWEWIQSNCNAFWPDGSSRTFPEGLDPKHLCACPDEGGPYDSQFFLANINPSERYTLTVAGSTQFRLQPWDTGFANLIFTGDWTRNGLNIGCVEATVMSGMEACYGLTKLATNKEEAYPALEDIGGYYHP